MPAPSDPASALLPRSFSVIVKPTGAACNLSCEYCYYREKDALYPPTASRRMSDAVLESFTRQYIESQPQGEVVFSWQGGEPTLLGVQFFRRAVEIQKRYADGQPVANTLQTNGVLLDEEWCSFLAENRFLVGVSVDGPPDLHDRFRRDGTDGPTAERVLRGIREMSARGVQFNTLTVVNRVNADKPLEVYRHLRSIGSRFMQFIPLVERLTDGNHAGRALAGPPGTGDGDAATVAPWSVQPRQYRDFLCAIFDLWVREDVGRVYVQLFDAALGAWTGSGSGLCVLDRRCGSALALECNGDLYSCDHFVYPEFRLGNILETPLVDLARGRSQEVFADAKNGTLPRQCRECPVLFACNGGCPKHRFLRSADGGPGLSYLCSAYRGFYAHAGPSFDVMARLLEAGRPPALVMDAIRAHDLKRRLAVAGRNDPCPCGSGLKFKLCCGNRPRTI